MVIIEAYTDVHRATLQTLMNHGSLEEDELKDIFKEIWEKLNGNRPMDEDALSKAIDQINDRIGRFDQKIVKYQYGLNLQDYYIFCATAKTSISNMQHCYTEHEVDFFKQILTKIVENIDLNISPREALNLQSSHAGKLNKMRSEKLLDAWCTSGYFVRHDNLIFLGPKSLTEFKEDLKGMKAEHLKGCGLCDDIAAWGISCNACKTAKSTYHKNCIEKFLARSDKCPSCKTKWTVPMEEQ